MFTVLGEALLDMVQPAPGDLYRALPAGGPLNVAVGLRRLGHPTALMARFATGALGRRIRDFVAASDLDSSACVMTDRNASLAFATVDENGHASYDFVVDGAADWDWTEEDLDRLPTQTVAVHTGSLAATLEPGASRILAWWEGLAAENRILLSFDPNVRPALSGRREDAVRRVERFAASSHVFKASDEDLGWLYPNVGSLDAIRHLARLGPSLAVLTCGACGCVGVTTHGTELAMSAPVIPLADTIGAGDAFQSGLLSALADLSLLAPPSLASVDETGLRRLLERALDVAALTCAQAGARPPARQEYDGYARRRVDA